MSGRALLQLDANLARFDAVTASSGEQYDATPATPSKDKFREWTFPRKPAAANNAGGFSPTTATSGSTGNAHASRSANPPPPRPSSSGARAGAAGIRTGSISSAAARRRPSVAARQSRAANLFSSGSSASEAEPVHGRSSSIAHTTTTAATTTTSPKRQRPVGSPDVRHRSNASLLASPVASRTAATASHSSPFVKLSLPGAPTSPFSTSGVSSAPRAAFHLVYTNLRRKSLAEVVYLALFCGSILVWAGALCGYGHSPALAPSAADLNVPGASAREVVDVQIPANLLAAEGRAEDESEYLADVHLRKGDSSHDEGEDHFQASPSDPALEDENHPHVHHNEEHDSLWSNHEADAEAGADADADAEGQVSLGFDLEHHETVETEGLDHPAVELDEAVTASNQDASEHDWLATAPSVEEKEDAEVSPPVMDRQVAEAADLEALEEDAVEEIVDDSIQFEAPPAPAEDEAEDATLSSTRNGALRVVDAEDSADAPTALDELLKSAAAEARATDGKGQPADALFRAPSTGGGAKEGEGRPRRGRQQKRNGASGRTKSGSSASRKGSRDQQQAASSKGGQDEVRGMKVVVRRD